jgi:hypothetical protein
VLAIVDQQLEMLALQREGVIVEAAQPLQQFVWHAVGLRA